MTIRIIMERKPDTKFNMESDNAAKEEKILQKLIQKLKDNGFTDYEFNTDVRNKNQCVDLVVEKNKVRVMAFELKSRYSKPEFLREQFGSYNLEIPLYYACLNGGKDLSISEFRNGCFETVSINEITPRVVASNIKVKAFEEFENKLGQHQIFPNAELKVNRRIWYAASALCLIYLIAAIIAMNCKCFYLPVDLSVIVWILLIVVLSLMPDVLNGTKGGKNFIEAVKNISKIGS